jgi:hypothetical protein
MMRLILITFLLLLIGCESNEGQFLLSNQSNEVIAKAEIKVGKQLFEFTDIVVGDEFTESYSVLVDSHYEIKITFESGESFQKSIGYMTNGFDYDHSIIVTDDDIKISDVAIK